MIYNGRIEDFIPLLDFLANTFGNGIEFTLHDFSKPGKTIIAIRNGQITGRQVGDSISNFTLRAIQESVKDSEDLSELKSKILEKKDLKTGDLLIMGEDGTIKGLLCVNIPLPGLREMSRLLEGLLGTAPPSEPAPPAPPASYDVGSFEGLAESIIDGVLAESDVSPDRMTPEERIMVIERIHNKGVFQLKGVVGLVSRKLNVSEATVYRYLGYLS
ncbi:MULTISPECIES: helix-turn-helix transcriptional regulator [Anaerotruncus]|jgi:predicted transcriptional regulator YheO|uniref:Transcriptional regulator n=1 Tax=Anaerotruncus colihominis TaxID=169435 RepID=A0A845SWY1_9FIRM|nr:MULTISPECIES: PAS domain-containing protein [Anaerotruncus]MCI8492652.1 hypothetical protein [Anaerotruncus sp.]MCR2024010.1 PAS domain-containing protein [Anaerotruncus colihominis]NDO39438.1 hypothetical protein [Anaerotruncus colihominis]